ncbi:hypothetical protein BDV18DRAFT_58870 [Aspergillus unguis]
MPLLMNLVSSSIRLVLYYKSRTRQPCMMFTPLIYFSHLLLDSQGLSLRRRIPASTCICVSCSRSLATLFERSKIDPGLLSCFSVGLYFSSYLCTSQ